MLSRGSTQLMIVDCPEREYAGSCWCWCSSKILCTNNGVGFVVVVADADLLLLFFCMLFSSSSSSSLSSFPPAIAAASPSRSLLSFSLSYRRRLPPPPLLLLLPLRGKQLNPWMRTRRRTRRKQFLCRYRPSTLPR